LISTANTSAGSIDHLRTQLYAVFRWYFVSDKSIRTLPSCKLVLSFPQNSSKYPEASRNSLSLSSGSLSSAIAGCLKLGFNLFHGPIDILIGSIIQHFANKLAPDPSIVGSFHLHQSGNCILIEKWMINRPPISAIFLRRQNHLPGNEKALFSAIRYLSDFQARRLGYLAKSSCNRSPQRYKAALPSPQAGRRSGFVANCRDPFLKLLIRK
jgi:hypothetical protein